MSERMRSRPSKAIGKFKDAYVMLGTVPFDTTRARLDAYTAGSLVQINALMRYNSCTATFLSYGEGQIS